MQIFKKDISDIEYYLPSYKELHEGLSMSPNPICEQTDYSALTGLTYFVKNDRGNQSKHNGGGAYWTSTKFGDIFLECSVNVVVAFMKDNFYCYYPKKDSTDVGVRPKVKYSDIKKYSTLIQDTETISDERMKKKYFEVEFGEYPQWIVSNKLNDILEEEYSKGKLNRTGKNYISGILDQKMCFEEYTYNNKKYIRIDKSQVSKYIKNNTYWVEVSPIIWQVDPKKNVALCKNVLFTGVTKSKMKQFFKENFSKDIIPSAKSLSTIKTLSASKKEFSSADSNEVDKLISNLKNVDVKEVCTTNLDSLINYGDELSKNTDLVNAEYQKLIVNNLLETSLSDVEKIVGEIENIKPVNKKKSIFDRLSFKNGQIQEEQKEMNIDILTRLNESINCGISDLNRELSGYDSIKRYNEVYIDKLKKCISLTKEAINKETQAASVCENENEKLNHATNIEILKNKLNNFEISLVSKMSELVQIHQSIINHFVTISSLKTAREDLVPLIASEIAISIGNNTERKSLELSKCVVGLFNSLLERNAEGTKENLERLKSTGLSKETISKISNDLESYLSTANALTMTTQFDDNPLRKVKTARVIIKNI